MPTPSCPVCDGTQWLPWHEPPARHGEPAHRFVRCAICSLARIDPFPEPAALRATFDDSYFQGGGERGGYADYDADAAVHLVNAKARMRRVSKQAHGSGVLVDVGCASGYTLAAARQLGWQGVGIEISPQAADRARAKGFRVEADLQDLIDGPDSLVGEVDVVSFFQVLEHLPEPGRALAAAARLLRPGGSLVIETWDADSLVARAFADQWQQLSASVLWVFNRSTMAQLCTREGFTLSRWAPSAKWVSVGLVAGQVVPRLPDTPAGLRRAASAVLAPVSRLRAPYALGDLVTVTAQRDARHTHPR